MFKIIIRLYFINVLLINARRSPFTFFQNWLSFFQTTSFETHRLTYNSPIYLHFQSYSSYFYVRPTNKFFETSNLNQKWCDPNYSKLLIPYCKCDGPSNHRIITCKSFDDIKDLFPLINSELGSLNFGQLSLTESNIETLKSDQVFNKSFKNIIIRKNNL